MVEKKLKEFNDACKNGAEEGEGSKNTAAIVMNPNNGEIYAMANYPTFDLNNPRDLSAYYSEEQIKAIDVYKRQSHVLAEAVKRLFPNVKLAIGPSIDEGLDVYKRQVMERHRAEAIIRNLQKRHRWTPLF